MPYTAKEYLLSDHPRTLFPLDLTRVMIDGGYDRVVHYITEHISDQGGLRDLLTPQKRCYAAKHGFHLRRTLLLDPVAALLIYDLVLRNRKHFKQDKRRSRRHYGYYFKGGEPGSPMQSYNDFKEDLRFAKSDYEFGLKLDVASYFNSIYHHDLVGYVDNMGWSSGDKNTLASFLSGINGSRSIDCLPQGIHPCKVLGASFLELVDRHARLHSKRILRFLDDFHLFSNDVTDLEADLVLMQRILGEKGLSLNSAKTEWHDASKQDLEATLDEIKIGLLRLRRSRITASGEVEDSIEVESLDEKQTEYLLGLLRQPDIEEADAELVLTLLTEHGEEVLDSMVSIWPKYPALSKPLYSYVSRAWWEHSSLLALARGFLSNAPTATEYQLFWLAKTLQKWAERDTDFGDIMMRIYDHPNATAIVQAKILEIADRRFGLTELREEVLRGGQSDWPSWAAAIGSRVLSKSSRNQLLKHFGKVAPLNKVIADVASQLEAVDSDERKWGLRF